MSMTRSDVNDESGRQADADADGDADAARYARQYEQSRFRRKVAGVARVAGRGVIERALRFWYALRSSSLPWRDKIIIYGALGYFIMPIDVIPDFIPVLGFTDDLGVLIASLAAVAHHITPEVKRLASEKAGRLFGTDSSRAEVIDK